MGSSWCAGTAAWLRLNVILYNLLSADKRGGLPEEFHTGRPKRLRFLLLNTVGKVVRPELCSRRT